MTMCVHKVWNLKYDAAEMTAATNEDCLRWLLENCCFMGKKWKFWQQKNESIKGDFSDGGNE